MAKFATIDNTPGNPFPALLWEERDGRYVVTDRLRSEGDVPDGVEKHEFERPTTAGLGGPNGGRYPVLDVDGAPLWEGARIEFRVQGYHVNTQSGTGVFTSVDRYGGASYVSDVAIPVHGRDGEILERRRVRYSAFAQFDGAGETEGHRRLSGKLGDPHEHGTTPTFVRLASDPRDACIPVAVPLAGPR